MIRSFASRINPDEQQVNFSTQRLGPHSESGVMGDDVEKMFEEEIVETLIVASIYFTFDVATRLGCCPHASSFRGDYGEKFSKSLFR